MRRKKVIRAPRRLRDRDINPYLASATESAPERRTSRADAGALMGFLASVIGPLVLSALFAVMGTVRFGTLDVRLVADISGLGCLAAPLGIMLAVGVYLLTDKRRFEMISAELRAVTRLSAVVHAVTLVLAVVAYVRRDWSDYISFEHASHFTGNGAEAFLALVVARHLARLGAGGAAKAARWLAAAMLAALVAEILLTRTTHDELFNPVPPRHAYLVLPISVVLWIGKLAIFGTLWRALAKRGSSMPLQEMSK